MRILSWEGPTGRTYFKPAEVGLLGTVTVPATPTALLSLPTFSLFSLQYVDGSALADLMVTTPGSPRAVNIYPSLAGLGVSSSAAFSLTGANFSSTTFGNSYAE